MFSFNGDFRRKPVQSMRGNSKKEPKESLIKRVQDERQSREDQRKQQASAGKIQKYYRGHICRRKHEIEIKAEFDSLLITLRKEEVSCKDLYVLALKLLYFFKPREDGQRLIWLFHHLLNKRLQYIRYVDQLNQTGIYHLAKLLRLCLVYLRFIASYPDPIAIPMRVFEVFTSRNTYENEIITGRKDQRIITYILGFLIREGYLECFKELLLKKVPDSLEPTTEPPTPISSSLFDLIMIPVELTSASTEEGFNHEVMRSLSEVFFCPKYYPQVENFLIPAMSCGKNHFPFIQLIRSLLVSTPDCNLTLCLEKPSPYLLVSVLSLSKQHIVKMSPDENYFYLRLLELLLPYLPPAQKYDTDADMSDNEDDEMMMETDSSDADTSLLHETLFSVLDSSEHMKMVLNYAHNSSSKIAYEAMCGVCFSLLFVQRIPMHRMRLLYTLSLDIKFIRNLWFMCSSSRMETSSTGSTVPLLSALAQSLKISTACRRKMIPMLCVFCEMFSHSLLSLHDSDCYGDEMNQTSGMPFSVSELIPMTRLLCEVCIGIIDYAYPDAKLSVNEEYREALFDTKRKETALEIQEQETKMWTYMFKVVSTLVRQLYNRGNQQLFFNGSHWLSRQISIPVQVAIQIYRKQLFASFTPFKKDDTYDDGPPLTNQDIRSLIILTELPFVVPFEERVKIVQRLIMADKEDNQGDMTNFLVGPAIDVVIRRNYIYEDAFEKLSKENEPNMKLKMRVHLVNAVGLDEAGIDGGGIFREFLTLLLKSAFDPNRGFFQSTTDRLIYPNPNASYLEENYAKHYYFIGRMLGKAIYENMLIELPFAGFFLAKILSRHSSDLDLHHVQSLDPVMYKNLMYLKTYTGDVCDLGLDFTAVNSGFGETEVIELKPGGRNIPVTNENKIEYIHLMADYKLNKQIRNHCAAFRQGMSDVINLEWLHMFNHQELQILISGSSIPVDIEDLQRHTNYSGGFTEEHPVIKNFWKVVKQFNNKQKSQLLKFVTSCSQQPLLGFKDLVPSFCIHDAGPDEERLPTASTCMNLLKLPHFKEEAQLRTKLLYAIESNSGFELS